MAHDIHRELTETRHVSAPCYLCLRYNEIRDVKIRSTTIFLVSELVYGDRARCQSYISLVDVLVLFTVGVLFYYARVMR